MKVKVLNKQNSRIENKYRVFLFIVLCLLAMVNGCNKEDKTSENINTPDTKALTSKTSIESIDKILDIDILEEEVSVGGTRGAKEEFFWSTGQIVRIRFESGDWLLQESVRSWITEVTKHANLRFLWHMYHGPESPKYSADVTIDFGQGDESLKHLIASAIGTEAYFYPEGNPTMKLNAVATAFNEIAEATKQIEFLESGSANHSTYYNHTDKEYLENTIIPHYFNIARTQVMHEALHMLGFVHEHQHPYANIPWKANVDLKLEAKDLMIIKYDPASLTHYPTQQYEHLVVQDAQLKQLGYNLELSQGDIERIKMLYPYEEIDPPTLPQKWVDAGLFSMPETLD